MKGGYAVLAVAAALCASVSAAPLETVQRELAFDGAGGVSLVGTLLLPKSGAGAARPAVLLLAGSGPTDRNGNQPPHLHTDLLKQLAELLAQHGYGSLRFDKRGQYGSGKAPAEPGDLSQFVAWDNFVQDAVAALRALQKQPEVDVRRAAVIGHSEGGLIAMHVARQLAGDPSAPAAVALLATPGRPLDAVLRDQLSSLLARQKATPEQATFFLDKNDAIIAEIRKTGKVPADVPPGLKALYPNYIGGFLQGQLKTDPADLLARVKGPVLVLQGDKDVQVSAERDAGMLARVLKNHPRAGTAVAIIPGASHNLKRVKDGSDPGYAGPITPEAAEALVRWLNPALAGPGGEP